MEMKNTEKKSKRLRKDVSVYMYEFGNIKKINCLCIQIICAIGGC